LSAAGLDGTYGVFGPDGRAVALARDEEQSAKAVLVLTPH
jgi:tRNA pseudouridine55 synthase